MEAARFAGVWASQQLRQVTPALTGQCVCPRTGPCLGALSSPGLFLADSVLSFWVSFLL